jgi:lauroyl/myristoyl acyltransferase
MNQEVIYSIVESPEELVARVARRKRRAQAETNLRYALTQTDRTQYEKLRASLTEEFGYDGFREIQRAAFRVIASNCCG